MSQKAGPLYYIRPERFASNKYSSLMGPFVTHKKMKCCEYGPWVCIHKTSYELLKVKILDWVPYEYSEEAFLR
jgi:hypothetical protein